MLTIVDKGHATGSDFVSDTRATRMLALYVPVGSSPSSFAAPGPFKATFEGDLNMRLRDFLVFSAVGRGKFTLTINGKPVLDASGEDLSQTQSNSTRLNKGKNHVVANYQSPATGDAAVRLFWQTKGNPPEPVPPASFSHPANAKSLLAGQRVREGRFLVGQLRCTKCHATDGIVDPADKEAMPELAMDAPSLKDVGARINSDWMAAWISNPKAIWAGAHMPRLFATKGPDELAPEAKDIAAYLATLGANAPVGNAPAESKKAAGALLFTNLNCVACHISPERTGAANPAIDAGRVPLGYVKAKYKPAALTQFLLNPAAHFAWIPMPNFKLSTDEAEGLAAYLLSIDAKPLPTASGGNAQNGEKLIRSVGCLNCHVVGDKPSANDPARAPLALNAIPKAGWTQGCLAPDAAARKAAPDFGLTDIQRAAIVAFAATDRSSLKHDAPAEFAERQIAVLRCAACHARDGHESLLATDLAPELEEMRTKYPNPQQGNGEGIAPDQRAPLLTWAGEKLRPEWMAKFIGGQVPYKPRYYLRARMPAFASRAELLTRGLAEEHGCSPAYPPYGPPDAKLAEVGQTLVGKAPNASFGCVQCHAVGPQPPLAPFEAPAINFMHVTERLRQDYYYRWIHNPLAIDPETKMPRFDDAEGKTGVAVFDNDARKQFEAIWNYLLTGKDIKPPAQ